eukprot:8643629-Pyramimonas_sp.AAC.1
MQWSGAFPQDPSCVRTAARRWRPSPRQKAYLAPLPYSGGSCHAATAKRQSGRRELNIDHDAVAKCTVTCCLARMVPLRDADRMGAPPPLANNAMRSQGDRPLTKGEEGVWKSSRPRPPTPRGL